MNFQNCVSSRQFTDRLKDYIVHNLEMGKLDLVGMSVLLHELGKIERVSSLSFHQQGTFIEQIVRTHGEFLMTRMHQFTTKQLMIIISGLASFFVD